MILHPGDIIHLNYPYHSTSQQRVDIENWYRSQGVTVGVSTTNDSIHTYQVVAVIRKSPVVTVIDTPSSL